MPNLAVHGGSRVVPDGYVKSWPPIDDGDVEAVANALRSGTIWGSGPEVTALAEEWARYLGVKYCFCLSGGTAALHGGLAAAGVGPGDEVILPAFSFYSTATPVVHQNAIPIFVDIDPRTFNIDTSKIEAKITEKTKAIVPVHLWGLPADMDEILAIARQHNLFVVEDACQAHGAEYKGKKVGTLGNCAAFSLNGSKNLPGGEGGLFVTDDEDIRNKAARLEMTVQIKEGVRHYPIYSLGYNYRMQEMTAAFTRSQLRKLDDLNAGRVRNCEYLSAELSKLPGVVTPYAPADRKHVYHMYRVRFVPQKAGVDASPQEFRDKIEAALNAEGVPASQWVKEILPGHALYQERNAYGKGCPWECPHARPGVSYPADRFEQDYTEAVRMLQDSTLIWGFWPPNDRDLMEMYVAAFRKLWENLDEVADVKTD